MLLAETNLLPHSFIGKKKNKKKEKFPFFIYDGVSIGFSMGILQVFKYFFYREIL